MVVDSQAVGKQSKLPLRVLLIVELNVASRFWEGSVPLLRAAGIEVFVASIRERGELHKNVEALGGHTLALNSRSSFDYPLASLRLAKYIRQNRIDIIQACEAIPGSIAGLAGLLAGRGVRIFHRVHTIDQGREQRLLSRISSRLSHLTMAISQSSAHYANDLDGVPWSRIRVAYCGVNQPRQVSKEEVLELRRSLGIPEDAPVISMVARLSQEKGHRTLFEAVRLLNKSLPKPPHLVIAGAGADEEALKECASSLSPAVVHFVGHQKDVAPWFTLADVVAVPSYQEAFGLSAAEALACSRPVVASKVGGLQEVIEDGVSGLLVPPKDPDALAERIELLLRSPARAAEISAGGYERFRKQFTMEAMVQGWIDCYREAQRQPKR
ncbi:MAG: glycosyltransferase [Acidobacteriota bacterium]|nr:glycosyltransferase [Acidobacteriota bacterium]